MKDTADMNNLNMYENEYPCLAGRMDWQKVHIIIPVAV